MASLSFGYNSKPESSIGSDTALSGESAKPEAGLFKMEFLDFGALGALEKNRNLSPVELPSVELAWAASNGRSESAFSGHQMQTLRRELELVGP